jgi:hypothetical protein
MARETSKRPIPASDPGPFRKNYSAVIRSDGAMLPIEERLGRRLLRSLQPESLEARRLLHDGAVAFVMPDGTALSGLPIAAVYERLAAETAAHRPVSHGTPGARRASRETLAAIQRWKRALSIDH